METEATKHAPILDIAWQRHADLDLSADRRTQAFYDIRRLITVLGVLATLFAILTQQFFSDTTTLQGVVVKVLFVATPVLASIFAAFAAKFYSNGSWLIYRAGAEEIKKEIYFYRTILPKDKSRRDHLEKRLGEIQRQLFRSLGGEFAFEGYKGPLPSNYTAGDEYSDPGFHDLTGDEYVKYRLKHQLDWHNGRIIRRKRERRWMTIYILTIGGLGAILATLGGPLALWVAFTASVTAGLIGWQELRKVDETIKNYSKVVMELTIIYDHWQNLEPEERTAEEFGKMVRSCEHVLWAQNVEFVKSMQETLQEADLEREAILINQVIQESVESAERAKETLRENILETHREFLADTEVKLDQAAKAVLGTLAEEASSEIVQKELDAMSSAVTEKGRKMIARASSFLSSITEVKEEFKDVEITKDTSTEELNTILARYPTTPDVKG
jgi:hypothetical protein